MVRLPRRGKEKPHVKRGGKYDPAIKVEGLNGFGGVILVANIKYVIIFEIEANLLRRKNQAHYGHEKRLAWIKLLKKS
jgi:hypothetical protein